MRAGQVKMWLDQGPAVLLEVCDVEGESISIDQADDVIPTKEKGWIIHLLMTNELLTVHEETLHNGEIIFND